MLTRAVEMSRRNDDKLLILLALRIFDTVLQVTENTPHAQRARLVQSAAQSPHDD